MLKNNVFFIGFLLLFVGTMFCGCQETEQARRERERVAQRLAQEENDHFLAARMQVDEHEQAEEEAARRQEALRQMTLAQAERESFISTQRRYVQDNQLYDVSIMNRQGRIGYAGLEDALTTDLSALMREIQRRITVRSINSRIRREGLPRATTPGLHGDAKDGELCRCEECDARSASWRYRNMGLSSR